MRYFNGTKENYKDKVRRFKPFYQCQESRSTGRRS